MAQQPHHSLQEILDFCSSRLPALAGSVRPSEAFADDADGQMAKILRDLNRAYPEAGPIYWICRVWQLWLWQPVFIGVWAASLWRVSIDMDGFYHRMGMLFTESYTLPEQTLVSATESAAVWQTAIYLKHWQQRELVRIRRYGAMSDKLADYFLGDAVLQALATAHRLGLMSREETQRAEQIWQQALAFRCHGRLLWQEDAQEFFVAKVSCCQHYRRQDAEYCVGCPKTRAKTC